jgi:peptidyl-prolyl cis-trans isomerase D
LAYPVEPSEATKVQTLKDASAFAVEAKGSIEKFKEVAAAKSIMTSSMNVERGNRNVPGLSNSLEVVRWANEAKVGDVSELISIDGNYVVAVVTAIDDEEYKALDKVSAQIKNTLVREKKAEMLKAKMQGSSLDEIAVKVEGKIENFADAKSTSHYTQGLGVEPRVFRALASVTAENKGALLPLIDGGRGVYAVVVDEVVAAETPQTVEAERVKAQAEEDQRAMRFAWGAIRESANVVDNTAKFF